jgi:hypothetical protein
MNSVLNGFSLELMKISKQILLLNRRVTFTRLFFDSSGYGVLNKEKAIEGLQKDMETYGMYFEPYHSMTGVCDHASEL